MANNGSSGTLNFDGDYNLVHHQVPSRRGQVVIRVAGLVALVLILQVILSVATSIATLHVWCGTHSCVNVKPNPPILPAPGVRREYFLQIEEVLWDYAPSGRNLHMDRPFNEAEQVFTKHVAGSRVGTKYTKARYVQYSDASFSVTVEQDPHLGLEGPMLHMEEGDTLEVTVRNTASFNYSFHVHGLPYAKRDEGAKYYPFGPGQAIAPGTTYTYKYNVTGAAAPTIQDPSSILWLYHSHTDPVADPYSGLHGPLIVTRRGMADKDGKPTYVDQELFVMSLVGNEGASHYIQENMQANSIPSSLQDDDEFAESNLMHNMNGYSFANLPGLELVAGTTVRWYLAAMGTEVDLHSPHWHGHTVLHHGHRQDVVNLLPATHVTADMTPTEVGEWLFHCHVDDHIEAGMLSHYMVVAH